IPTVTLDALTAAEYDRPRGDLPGLHLSFEAPVTHGAVLRTLGAPAAWRGADSPAEALTPLVRAAAERARQIALAEAAPPGPRTMPTQPEEEATMATATKQAAPKKTTAKKAPAATRAAPKTTTTKQPA